MAESRCFTGFDAFQKLLATDVDLVIHATPPHFRSAHMAGVVDARKHLFMEKPVAVDVPGAKAVMQTAERATSLGLCVVTARSCAASICAPPSGSACATA